MDSTTVLRLFDCVDHNKLLTILKEIGVPDHFTCLLRNLYVGQETRVKILHGTAEWFKIGKEEDKAVYYHLIYLTCTQSTSCEILSWWNLKLELRLLGEISTISDMQITTPLWQKVKN